MEKPQNCKLLRFTGKFKDLIPQGFKFHKLFAHNYRSYSRNIDPNNKSDYGNTIWVWQHLGGYVEFMDLHERSYVLLEMAQDMVENGKDSKWCWSKSGDGYFTLYVNFLTGEYKTIQHNPIL